MALGDRRRNFGVVGEESEPVAVTQADVVRFLNLVDLLSDVEKTKARAIEAGRCQTVIDQAARDTAALGELKEKAAEEYAAHRKRIDDEHGALSEEVRQARAELAGDKKVVQKLKEEAESDRAAAARDKAEAARRLRAMSGEAA